MATGVVPERVTAAVDGDFVVFRVGIRINAFRKIHQWLPVFLAMPRMLRELDADPERGLLGYRANLGIRNHEVVQYWRSFDHLREYARDPDAEHLPAWDRFTREVGSNGDVGIWHETYLIREGEYEAVYNNMPPFGLGEVGELVPATGELETAADRIGRAAESETPADAGDNGAAEPDDDGA